MRADSTEYGEEKSLYQAIAQAILQRRQELRSIHNDSRGEPRQSAEDFDVHHKSLLWSLSSSLGSRLSTTFSKERIKEYRAEFSEAIKRYTRDLPDEGTIWVTLAEKSISLKEKAAEKAFADAQDEEINAMVAQSPKSVELTNTTGLAHCNCHCFLIFLKMWACLNGLTTLYQNQLWFWRQANCLIHFRKYNWLSTWWLSHRNIDDFTIELAREAGFHEPVFKEAESQPRACNDCGEASGNDVLASCSCRLDEFRCEDCMKRHQAEVLHARYTQRRGKHL